MASRNCRNPKPLLHFGHTSEIWQHLPIHSLATTTTSRPDGAMGCAQCQWSLLLCFVISMVCLRNQLGFCYRTAQNCYTYHQEDGPIRKTQDFTLSCYEPTSNEWLKALEHWHARAQPFVLRKFILLLRG